MKNTKIIQPEAMALHAAASRKEHIEPIPQPATPAGSESARVKPYRHRQRAASAPQKPTPPARYVPYRTAPVVTNRPPIHIFHDMNDQFIIFCNETFI